MIAVGDLQCWDLAALGQLINIFVMVEFTFGSVVSAREPEWTAA